MSGEAPVAILAGSGDLPRLLADRLTALARPHRILAWRGFADRPTLGRADAVVGLLDVRRTVACLGQWRPSCVVLAGGVRRPGAAALLDAYALLRNREEVARIIARGDDNLLRGAIDLLEERGHRLVGIGDLAPDLLAQPGPLGRLAPGAADQAAMAFGFGLLDALSPFDIGQAAAVRGERVLAVEGPEGTDGMLARAARLSGRAPWRFARRGREARAGVLVKAAKRGQDRRVDLPTIGPRTIRLAAAAGLAGVAVSSGTTLIVDRPGTAALADRLGLFVVGSPAGPEGSEG